MFSLVWGPTLAAVSVVLDHSHDPLVIRQALEGLKLVAKMAAFHQLDQVSVCVCVCDMRGVCVCVSMCW